MAVIAQLDALEILDSRGRPTVAATCRLAGGGTGRASVPSGASTGAAEAIELRDGDAARHAGLGCRRAVANVIGPITDAVRGQILNHQFDLDQALLDLDGTASKSRLGANAILAVSLAFARAHATERNIPLYRHFAEMIDQQPSRLPRMTINLYSGGKHAGGQIPIQDVLVVPASANTIERGLEMTCAVYQAAVRLIGERYRARPLVADEGGLAPPFPDADAMLRDSVDAITAAGLRPGKDVVLAVDVASSHFYRDGRYHLGAQPLDSAAMSEQVSRWIEEYPIVSIEDALAEDDWDHWPHLCQRIGDRALVLGDDLLCTNPERIRRAIDTGAASALLLKVNQIGTLKEAAEAMHLARAADWHITISARSGETEDDWLADLAVGWSGDQIKIGSITRSERLAKYNRLLAIEAETRLPVTSWPGR
jgi:enolase